jgi:hypothetical protein
MSVTLIFVLVVVLAAAGLVFTTSVVGSRRRAQGRRLDVQVRGFRNR